MVPTSRAIELSAKISAVLLIIKDDILQPSVFDASKFSGKIVIGLSDYAEQIFGPELFDHLTEQAPQCQILFRPVDSEDCEHALQEQHIDIAMGAFKIQSPHLQSTFLYRERHVCLFDNSVLKVPLPITLEDYTNTDQVIITANQSLSNNVDIKLAQLNQSRHVILGSTRFLTLPRIISGRRLLCVMAEMVGKSELFSPNITLCPPPISIPDFDITLLSRKRDKTHARMNWLARLVENVVQQKVALLRED